jgi:hypothetical protein
VTDAVRIAEYEAKIAVLERKVGQVTMAIDAYWVRQLVRERYHRVNTATKIFCLRPPGTILRPALARCASAGFSCLPHQSVHSVTTPPNEPG